MSSKDGLLLDGVEENFNNRDSRRLGPWIWEGLAEAKDLRGWVLSMVFFTS
jgi:hypothetical protein